MKEKSGRKEDGGDASVTIRPSRYGKLRFNGRLCLYVKPRVKKLYTLRVKTFSTKEGRPSTFLS